MIFEEVGVDPCKDFFLWIEEDHVFVDDEVSVVVCQAVAGINDGLGNGIPLLESVELL